MIRPRRSLTREEAKLWAAVAQTIKPLPGAIQPKVEQAELPNAVAVRAKPERKAASTTAPIAPKRAALLAATKPRPLDVHGLDAGWERKLAKSAIQPDFTLDLHGHTVSTAHARLDSGLGQALAMGARVVLVITGRPRPVEAADRGTMRGAIRAKVLDWLALGPHASRIAAVRPAQRRHGGAGALYVVLKRAR